VSTFLWVEDFEGGQYREFGHALFGKAFGLEASAFPDNENDLREFMKHNQVVLATNFAKAANYVDKNLRDFDYVVLDIDLNLLGEDVDDDLPWVEPVLERWYGFDPNAENIEASYDVARQKMKEVAGYHLFMDLVMNRGFPRDRILFCSNHGNHLDSINKSFEPARIEAPSIYKKSDEAVKQWIADQFEKSYPKLRRGIIVACEQLLKRMRCNQIRFSMPDLPRKGTSELTENNAEILLETLPRLLPAYENSVTERKIAFRLFARTLTQDWDKVDCKNKIKQPVKAFSAVLVNVRNWTSHDPKALSEMDEGFVAYLFLIAMRSCFDLPHNRLEGYERALFPLIGKAAVLDMGELTKDYMRSNGDVESKYALLDTEHPTSFFSSRVNALQQGVKITPEEQVSLLCQMLWHGLHRARDNIFSPQPDCFSKPAFLDQLTRCIYRRSFHN
jgi:hypothetical protein